MSTHKKLTFSKINKQKNLILINSMKELKNAFNKKQQIIALDKKPKVINSGNGGTKNPRKPPKYFIDFANQMLAFVKEQRKFNAQQEKNWEEQRKVNEEQRKFNKFVLDMFKKHKWIK